MVSLQSLQSRDAFMEVNTATTKKKPMNSRAPDELVPESKEEERNS